MVISVKKTLNTLVKSVQNQSISSKICPENSHKIIGFYQLVDISVNLSLKVSQNSTFFHDLSEALILGLKVLHLTSPHLFVLCCTYSSPLHILKLCLVSVIIQTIFMRMGLLTHCPTHLCGRDVAIEWLPPNFTS